MKNVTQTPLTKEEQKKMLTSLVKEDLFMTVFFSILLSSSILALVIGAYISPRFIILDVVVATLVLFLLVSMINTVRPSFKEYRALKSGTYTYHYLDIIKYAPDRYSYRVSYRLDETIHTTSTSIYGATKIHVFDCYGEYLTMVEEPTPDSEEREE